MRCKKSRRMHLKNRSAVFHSYGMSGSHPVAPSVDEATGFSRMWITNYQTTQRHSTVDRFSSLSLCSGQYNFRSVSEETVRLKGLGKTTSELIQNIRYPTSIRTVLIQNRREMLCFSSFEIIDKRICFFFGKHLYNVY
jgi:hypothetical protein